MLLAGTRQYLVALIAGALGALALPPFDIFVAFFISFTLLVWLLDGVSAGYRSGIVSRLWSSFFIGWLFGFGYFLVGLFCFNGALAEFTNISIFLSSPKVLLIAFVVLLASFYGIATFLAAILWSDGIGRICALACAFGYCEWLRSWIFTGFSWNCIGYAIMPIPMMMQSVHLIGLFGICALGVFCFSVPALIGTRQGMKTGVFLGAFLLIMHISYGAWVLNFFPNISQNIHKPFAIRIIQPNINQNMEMNKDNWEKVFKQYLDMTAHAPIPGNPEPVVIIWPEKAIPFIVTDKPDVLLRVAEVLKEGQILISGVVRKEEHGIRNKPIYYDSVYVIDNKGRILAASDKIHLIPFIEYLPYKDFFKVFGLSSFLKLRDYSSSSRRSERLILPNGTKLYSFISYEILFSNNIKVDSNSSDAILNLTDDSWISNITAAYQHFRYARIQAVELGLPLIRAANNGISAFVDEKGQIISSLGIDRIGSIDICFQPEITLGISTTARVRNFWLIEIVLLFGAFIGYSLLFFRRST